LGDAYFSKQITGQKGSIEGRFHQRAAVERWRRKRALFEGASLARRVVRGEQDIEIYDEFFVPKDLCRPRNFPSLRHLPKNPAVENCKAPENDCAEPP
jgi:hypothetical protein